MLAGDALDVVSIAHEWTPAARVRREIGSTVNSQADASEMVMPVGLVRVRLSAPASLNVIFTDSRFSSNVVPVDDKDAVRPSHVLSVLASGKVKNAGVMR